jgi:hypothetical protein
VAHGVDVHVLTRGEGSLPDEEERGGVLVHRVPTSARPTDLGEFVTTSPGATAARG